MPFIIGSPCIDVRDRSCIEECPVDCIYEGERMLYIHPDECVDCGARRATANVLDILRGGIDSALMGLGKSTIRDLSAADLLVPDDFTRALGALGE